MKPGRLALAGGGLVFIWSALSGASVTGTLRDLVSGRQPHGGANAILASTGGSGTGGAGNTGSGGKSGIAADAVKYNGAPYQWGGANAPHGADCSGLVNDVCGRDLGLPIPGSPSGKFSGHGPVTMQWFVWNGLRTIPDSEMQADDIVVWPSHMGIVTAPGQMISALNPNMGTRITPIKGYGPLGEPHRIRRYK